MANVYDYSVRDKPVFVRNSRENIISTEMLRIFFETLKFNVSLFEEEDGSFTGTLEELDLIENAPSKEDCLNYLLEAMKEYAQDFYNEFSQWSSAPNRKTHIPYVLKILSSPDSKLREDMICRNGKS